jgi:hypothetical protein
MQQTPKWVVGIAVLAGVVVVGVAIALWGGGGRAPQHPAAAEAPPVAVVASSRTAPPPPAPAQAAATNKPTNVTVAAPAAADATNGVAEWEEKVDEILGSDADDTNKVTQLFALFPKLPEEGQSEVAQHLSNLVPDDNYKPLGDLLQNAKLPESVLDVLMGDVLNRPNSVKLPELLSVAQNPDHPKVDEAKDLIVLYLDEEDPAKWPDALQKWLKENPD